LSLGCLSTTECVTRTVEVLATLAEKARDVKNAAVFETVEF
jgi:hypothetical protein